MIGIINQNVTKFLIDEPNRCWSNACKKALQETDGNQEEAIEVLRKKGETTAVKKAGRIAAEGIVYTAVKDNKTAIVEVNSEIDFVAKNDTFQAFVAKVADQILAGSATTVDELLEEKLISEDKTVKEELTSQIATIGENIDDDYKEHEKAILLE